MFLISEIKKLYRQYVAGSPRKNVFTPKTPLFPAVGEEIPVLDGRSKRRLTEPAAMADYITDMHKKRRNRKSSEISTSEDDSGKMASPQLTPPSVNQFVTNLKIVEPQSLPIPKVTLKLQNKGVTVFSSSESSTATVTRLTIKDPFINPTSTVLAESSFKKMNTSVEIVKKEKKSYVMFPVMSPDEDDIPEQDEKSIKKNYNIDEMSVLQAEDNSNAVVQTSVYTKQESTELNRTTKVSPKFSPTKIKRTSSSKLKVKFPFGVSKEFSRNKSLESRSSMEGNVKKVDQVKEQKEVASSKKRRLGSRGRKMSVSSESNVSKADDAILCKSNKVQQSSKGSKVTKLKKGKSLVKSKVLSTKSNLVKISDGKAVKFEEKYEIFKQKWKAEKVKRRRLLEQHQQSENEKEKNKETETNVAMEELKPLSLDSTKDLVTGQKIEPVKMLANIQVSKHTEKRGPRIKYTPSVRLGKSLKLDKHRRGRPLKYASKARVVSKEIKCEDGQEDKKGNTDLTRISKIKVDCEKTLDTGKPPVEEEEETEKLVETEKIIETEHMHETEKIIETEKTTEMGKTMETEKIAETGKIAETNVVTASEVDNKNMKLDASKPKPKVGWPKGKPRKKKKDLDGNYFLDTSRTPNLSDTLSLASMVAEERPSQRRRPEPIQSILHAKNMKHFNNRLSPLISPQKAPRYIIQAPSRSFMTLPIIRQPPVLSAAQIAASKIQRRVHQQKLMLLQATSEQSSHPNLKLDEPSTTGSISNTDSDDGIIIVQPSEDLVVSSASGNCKQNNELDLTDIKLRDSKPLKIQCKNNKLRKSLDFIAGRLKYRQKMEVIKQESYNRVPRMQHYQHRMQYYPNSANMSFHSQQQMMSCYTSGALMPPPNMYLQPNIPLVQNITDMSHNLPCHLSSPYMPQPSRHPFLPFAQNVMQTVPQIEQISPTSITCPKHPVLNRHPPHQSPLFQSSSPSWSYNNKHNTPRSDIPSKLVHPPPHVILPPGSVAVTGAQPQYKSPGVVPIRPKMMDDKESDLLQLRSGTSKKNEIMSTDEKEKEIKTTSEMESKMKKVEDIEQNSNDNTKETGEKNKVKKKNKKRVFPEKEVGYEFRKGKKKKRKELREMEEDAKKAKLDSERMLAPKEFNVDVALDVFKCTVPGCSKIFRKQHLLEYHTKYFHTVKPFQKRSRSSISVSSTESNPPSNLTSPVDNKNRIKSESLSRLSSVVSETEQSESSDAESDGEDIFPSVDECVKCVCEDDCELGFMIQCEQCFTWQHGECVGHSQQKTVPLFYLCHICSKPKGLRKSSMFNNDYTWYRHGRLPPINDRKNKPVVKSVDVEDEDVLSSIMLATHHMVTELYNIRDVLQGIRNKFVWFDDSKNEAELLEQYDGFSIDTFINNKRDSNFSSPELAVNTKISETSDRNLKNMIGAISIKSLEGEEKNVNNSHVDESRDQSVSVEDADEDSIPYMEAGYSFYPVDDKTEQKIQSNDLDKKNSPVGDQTNKLENITIDGKNESSVDNKAKKEIQIDNINQKKDQVFDKTESDIKVKNDIRKNVKCESLNEEKDSFFGCHGLDVFNSLKDVKNHSMENLIARYNLLVEVEKVENEINDRLIDMNKKLDELETEYDNIDQSKDILEEFNKTFQLPDMGSLVKFLNRMKWTSIIKSTENTET